jgi:hypothetical protein
VYVLRIFTYLFFLSLFLFPASQVDPSGEKMTKKPSDVNLVSYMDFLDNMKKKQKPTSSAVPPVTTTTTRASIMSTRASPTNLGSGTAKSKVRSTKRLKLEEKEGPQASDDDDGSEVDTTDYIDLMPDIDDKEDARYKSRQSHDRNVISRLDGIVDQRKRLEISQERVKKFLVKTREKYRNRPDMEQWKIKIDRKWNGRTDKTDLCLDDDEEEFGDTRWYCPVGGHPQTKMLLDGMFDLIPVLKCSLCLVEKGDEKDSCWNAECKKSPLFVIKKVCLPAEKAASEKETVAAASTTALEEAGDVTMETGENEKKDETKKVPFEFQVLPASTSTQAAAGDGDDDAMQGKKEGQAKGKSTSSAGGGDEGGLNKSLQPQLPGLNSKHVFVPSEEIALVMAPVQKYVGRKRRRTSKAISSSGEFLYDPLPVPAVPPGSNGNGVPRSGDAALFVSGMDDGLDYRWKHGSTWVEDMSEFYHQIAAKKVALQQASIGATAGVGGVPPGHAAPSNGIGAGQQSAVHTTAMAPSMGKMHLPPPSAYHPKIGGSSAPSAVVAPYKGGAGGAGAAGGSGTGGGSGALTSPQGGPPPAVQQQHPAPSHAHRQGLSGPGQGQGPPPPTSIMNAAGVGVGHAPQAAASQRHPTTHAMPSSQAPAYVHTALANARPPVEMLGGPRPTMLGGPRMWSPNERPGGFINTRNPPSADLASKMMSMHSGLNSAVGVGVGGASSLAVTAAPRSSEPSKPKGGKTKGPPAPAFGTTSMGAPISTGREIIGSKGGAIPVPVPALPGLAGGLHGHRNPQATRPFAHNPTPAFAPLSQTGVAHALPSLTNLPKMEDKTTIIPPAPVAVSEPIKTSTPVRRVIVDVKTSPPMQSKPPPVQPLLPPSSTPAEQPVHAHALPTNVSPVQPTPVQVPVVVEVKAQAVNPPQLQPPRPQPTAGLLPAKIESLEPPLKPTPVIPMLSAPASGLVPPPTVQVPGPASQSKPASSVKPPPVLPVNPLPVLPVNPQPTHAIPSLSHAKPPPIATNFQPPVALMNTQSPAPVNLQPPSPVIVQPPAPANSQLASANLQPAAAVVVGTEAQCNVNFTTSVLPLATVTPSLRPTETPPQPISMLAAQPAALKVWSAPPNEPVPQTRTVFAPSTAAVPQPTPTTVLHQPPVAAQMLPAPSKAQHEF